MAAGKRRSLAWLTVLLALGVAAGCESHAKRSGPTSSGPEPAMPIAENPPKPMEMSQTEYLWEIEGHGNKLARTNYGFKALGNALSRADKKALQDILATNFQGELLGKPIDEIRVANEFCEVIRQQEGSSPREKVNRDQFIGRLLQLREIFGSAPKVSIALMKLAPVNKEDMQGFWRGSCQVRIFGETAPGKPAEVILYLEYMVPEPNEGNLTKSGWLHEASLVQVQVAKAPRYLLRDVKSLEQTTIYVRDLQ